MLCWKHTKVVVNLFFRCKRMFKWISLSTFLFGSKLNERYCNLHSFRLVSSQSLQSQNVNILEIQANIETRVHIVKWNFCSDFRRNQFIIIIRLAPAFIFFYLISNMPKQTCWNGQMKKKGVHLIAQWTHTHKTDAGIIVTWCTKQPLHWHWQLEMTGTDLHLCKTSYMSARAHSARIFSSDHCVHRVFFSFPIRFLS